MGAGCLQRRRLGGAVGPMPLPPQPQPDPQQPQAKAKPNILFIAIDDFGVDQLTAYGYGGAAPAKTPNLSAIAEAGLLFRSAWAMPTCAPTRATFFTGRYPSSTNILNAVVSSDLANSEISPYEVTVPKLLKTQGYTSALIGKMHLTGSDLDGGRNLPYGWQTMWKLGFDHFDGYLDGAPYPIDTRAGLSTLGSDVSAGPYKCGFVPRAQFTGGADAGACYQVTGSCENLTVDSDGVAPGRACMERGGIFDPMQSCQNSVPAHLDFTAQNGYYTGEFIVSEADGSARKVTASDPTGRGYRSTMETDRAIAWARQQQGRGKPWMMTLGYSAIHAPLQLPPKALLSDDTLGRNDPFVCYPGSDAEEGPSLPGSVAGLVDPRLITNLMTEAMDKEIGRLLVELELAAWNSDGTLNYQPEKTNTVVVVMGDNGTYVNSVKLTAPGQFDATRSKGMPYQTGVWVPLLVAGPMVKQPGREVPHMVNAADLYQLFGELAGADVAASVPANRPVDGQPMLAYLTDPGQPSIRSINFTEVGTNFSNPQATATPFPCVIEAANTCIVLFPSKAVCEDQSGMWYGPGSAITGVPTPGGFSNCAQVSSLRAASAQSAVKVYPRAQKAVSDGTYKLVRLDRQNCPVSTDIDNAECDGYAQTDEFYRIDTATPNPTLDRDVGATLASPPIATATSTDGGAPVITGLSGEQRMAYDKLKAELDRRDATASYNQNYDSAHCPGDGNRDFAVDQADLDNWKELSQINGGQSSWYDLNHDGKTDAADQAIIQSNMGRRCDPLVVGAN
ncbi:sulfatase family protein [Xenophilus azovorans]|uniref:sulfatase family protein n=1 Tax=Xenophilus azovorans TaxID=151755 RepID=UPI00068EA47C|nr:sulfatase-like hydrolase/transferase [Xenophilus azovorans]